MINIEQRLLTLFENQRIVFWYDNNAELQEQFESIALEGVQKLIINNNEFGIKIEVLSLKPHNKFLIYSPTLAPKDEANWLLDLNIANYMFSADKTTLVLQNIGLDVSFREFVNRFDKFFNAPSRTDALKALIGSHENQESLALKMMALSIGSDDNLESIMFALFADEKHFEILVKYGLEKEFECNRNPRTSSPTHLTISQ